MHSRTLVPYDCYNYVLWIRCLNEINLMLKSNGSAESTYQLTNKLQANAARRSDYNVGWHLARKTKEGNRMKRSKLEDGVRL